MTTDDAPFFDACGIGLVDDLRGFATLGALATTSISAKVGCRKRFSNSRFGGVAFLGADAGGGGLEELSFDKRGVAVGAGLRYRVSRDFGLDYSIDVAQNDTGDTFLYLYLNYSF
ncbi:MAG: hypothetical protein AAF922_04440 [Pseudomonadota bacterium]